MKDIIQFNRKKFLEILRSGKYTKGTIKSDSLGNPVIESKEDDNGHCICAILIHNFGEEKNGKFSITKSMKALGLTSKDCHYMQYEINDTQDDFNTIADRIENEIFKK